MAPLLAVADGVAEYTTYFSTDGDALDDYGLTYPGKFSLDAAASAEANKAYVHVRQNASGLTDGKLIVGSIYVTDVTEALAGVNTLRTELSASIGNAQADATQALTSAASNSSALAQAETSLQAGIDSVSAEVTTQGTAISNLEGNASAGYLIKAQGGSAVSLLSLIAADGSSGSVSVAKLQADQILLQGSVGMDMLAVGVGRNLLENPDLAQGETAISKTSSNTVGSGATMTVRSDGSYSDAFNRTIRLQTFAQATFDGYIGVRFRPPDGNTGTLAPGYLAEPDQFFEFSAQLAVRRVRVVLRLYWLDSSGAEISNTAVFDNNWGTSTEGDATGIGRWARYGGIGKAPAATKYVRPEIRIIGTDASSSTRDTHILRPMLAEADSLDAPLSSYAPGGTTLVSGGRVVTNSLYADAVNTLSFAAAGLAIFGNALQSSNFNGTINSSGNITAEGSAGWAIGKNGSMVLNNLVAREWVKVGAVSDGASWSRAGNAKAEDDDVLHNSTLGAFRLGDFWQIACRVKYRTYSQYNVWIPPAGKGDGYNSAQWMRTNVLLQWRTKTGGSWSSWSALHSFGESGLNVSWYEKEVVISKMGNYEDVQVRIKIDHSFYAINGGSVGSTQGTFNNIGDMTLYAKALVR